jgi:hypothetical protein
MIPSYGEITCKEILIISIGGYSQIALLIKALGRGSPDLLRKGRLEILSYG